MKEIYSRRSVRNYLKTPVERDKILTVIKAGTCAPSALNNTERQFTAIINKQLTAKLNNAVASAADEATRQRILSRCNGEFSFFYNAPVLIVVSTSRDALCPAADCAVALENIFLKAEESGLSTCWINQLNSLCGNENVRKVLREAGIPDNHNIYGCCALGYSEAEKKIITEKQNKVVICD